MVKQNQFEQEHNAWRRSLEFFKQENALLKYRLSDMVDYKEENDFLQIAEYFQNELLLKDDMLSKLIKELQELSAEFDKYQTKEIQSAKTIARHDEFRSRVLKFEKGFSLLNKEFNEKMLQNM